MIEKKFNKTEQIELKTILYVFRIDFYFFFLFHFAFHIIWPLLIQTDFKQNIIVIQI